jgi:hypothetical protein
MHGRDYVMTGPAIAQPYARSFEIRLILHEHLGPVPIVRRLADSELRARRACEALFLASAIVRPGSVENP